MAIFRPDFDKASFSDKTQHVNMFLSEVKDKNGKKMIVDSDKVRKMNYFIENPALIDFIRNLDSCYLNVPQKEALAAFELIKEENCFSLNFSIPFLYPHLHKVIREKHTPGFCEDYVLLNDDLKVDLFITGILNEKIKQIMRYRERGNRKYLVLLALNEKCPKERCLESVYTHARRRVSDRINSNNNFIVQEMWKEVIDPEELIERKKKKLENILIGDIRIIISPNYIFHYYSSVTLNNPIKYFLKLTIHNNPSTEHKIITKFIPLSLFCVEKGSYVKEKYKIGFDSTEETLENQLQNKLKINSDSLIGIPNIYSLKNIDFPVCSTDDYISVSFIVTSQNKSRIIQEEKTINIGKIFSSSLYLNDLVQRIVNNIKEELLNREDLYCLLERKDDYYFKSSKEFLKNLRDPRMMERRCPILTQLELFDLFCYNNTEYLKNIIENNRHLIPQIEYRNNYTVVSTSGLSFAMTNLQLNSQIWIDAYWEISNLISKMFLDKWFHIFNEFSMRARNISKDFFYKRDLLYIPPGMTNEVFQKYIDDPTYIHNQEKIIRQYVIFKIYNDYIKEDLTSRSFLGDVFSLFQIPSVLLEKIEIEIQHNEEFKRIYREEYSKINVFDHLEQICKDIYFLNLLRKIPIDLILTNVTLEINVDSMMELIEKDAKTTNLKKKIFPEMICSDLQSALNIVNIMQKNSFQKVTITVDLKKYPEFKKYEQEPSPSSSSIDVPFYNANDSFAKFYESPAETSLNSSSQPIKEFRVEIIMFKKFNEFYKRIL